MKRLLVLLFCMFMIIGCGSTSTKESISFGTLPAEPSLPIIIAKEEGFFEKEGISVEILPFANPQERNAAAQAGELDGMIADVMTGMMFQDKGFDYVITSTINEDFKVLSSPESNIYTLSELDQKQVALIPGLVLEYIVDTMAKREGFTYQVLNMPSFPGRFEGLLNNQFEGVVFTEPQASSLVDKGAHELASSNALNINAGAILFTQGMNERKLKSFYRAYNNAVDYLNATDANTYTDKLEKYQFPSGMTEYINAKRGGFNKAESINQETLEDVAEWVKLKKLVESPVNLNDVVNYQGIK